MESYNRIEIRGCKVSLEQAGAPLCFWPYASEHVSLSRNIYPTPKCPNSPYCEKFEEQFPGLRIPFFARIKFIPVKPLAKAKNVHKCAPAMQWGVFLCWELKQGG